MDEIDRLRDLKQKALTKNVKHRVEKRISKMEGFLNGQTTEVLEYDE